MIFTQLVCLISRTSTSIKGRVAWNHVFCSEIDMVPIWVTPFVSTPSATALGHNIMAGTVCTGAPWHRHLHVICQLLHRALGPFAFARLITWQPAVKEGNSQMSTSQSQWFDHQNSGIDHDLSWSINIIVVKYNYCNILNRFRGLINIHQHACNHSGYGWIITTSPWPSAYQLGECW